MCAWGRSGWGWGGKGQLKGTGLQRKSKAKSRKSIPEVSRERPKKIETSLEKIPKITPKSDENHSKKGLGKLREARKWARVAKKRSKSDLR